MEQTAVEWLVEQICRKQDLTHRDIDKAKEMEKEQKNKLAIEFSNWLFNINKEVLNKQLKEFKKEKGL